MGTGELALAALPGIAAVGIWALKDLQRFVVFAVLSAMVLPVALLRPGGAQVGLADVLLLVALGMWVVNVAVGTQSGPWLARNPMLPALVLWVVVNAMSIGWSSDPSATTKTAIQMAEIVLVFPLVFATLPRSVATLRTGLIVFTITSCVLALVAFVLAAPDVARGKFEAVDLGLGLNKNAAGSYIAAGFVIAYVFLLEERRSGHRRLLAVLLAIDVLGMVATLSRGSMLGAVAAIIIASLLLRKGRMLTIGMAVVTTVVYLSALGTEGTGQTLNDRNEGYDSSDVRVYSFEAAVDTIKAHPVLGTGSGTYFDDIPELGIGLADPNNMFLLTWAEIGVFGMFALIFLLVRYGQLWWRVAALPRGSAVVGVAAGAVSLSLLVHFQFDVTWTRGTSSLAFACIGIMLAVERLTASDSLLAGVRSLPEPLAVTAPPPSPARTPQRYPVLPMGHGDSPLASPAEAPTPIVDLEDAFAIRRSIPAMRVLHVVSSDAFAGLERHALRLCERLRALGVDAVLLCPPSAARMREEAAAANVPVVPQRSTSSGRWLRNAIRAAKALEPDIVHVHDGRSAALGLLVAPKPARLVRTQHFSRPASVDRSGVKSRVSVGAHRRINRRYDGYIAVSRSAADAAVRRGEVDANRVAVIPPGVRLADDAAVERARDARAASGNDVRLAFAGRFETEKRVDVLLEALAMAREEAPNLRALIAGGGGQEQELHALSARLGLDDIVEWLGWVAEPDETLSRAHFYVNPLPEEGFGMAMAEAMSFELPVIAPTSGSSPELVQEGVTGLLVPPRDPAALATALVRLARDRELIARLGAQARARAIARYGVMQTATATAELYADLLDRPAR